jgi:hypothetical protein
MTKTHEVLGSLVERDDPQLGLRKEAMAPPGSFGLPPLLELRRLQYLIPNGAFAQRAIYDRMLLWQIPYYREKYGDTSIVMPETGKSRLKNEAPRGIIVTAGLQALDVLHDHGSGLGHIVKFIRLAPWRLPIDMIGGSEKELLILRCGDIIADEDLELKLRAREWAIRCERRTDKDGRPITTHVLVTEDGVARNPQVPFIAEEY